MNAQEQRNKFWNYFDNYLRKQGNPFYVCHTKGGINQSAGNINTTNPMDMQTICCEFKYREQAVVVQVYINGNTLLYEQLLSMKTTLEKELGFPVQWIHSGIKSDTVRRIQKTFYFYDEYSYPEVIEQAFPCILSFIRVFGKYV